MTNSQKKPWNTGFKPGRPRIGELRLVSPNAEKIQEWRKKNLEYYREKNRIAQAKWRAENIERSREITRNSRSRLAERTKNKLTTLAITK